MTDIKKRNFLARAWFGFWRGVTTLRMAVFNVIFLIVVVAIISSMLSGGDDIEIKEGTTLVINPKGVIVEQKSGSPIDEIVGEVTGDAEPQVQLRDLVAVLEAAADDDRITQVLISLDGFSGMGAGMMLEVSDAFAAFKQSEKRVIAYGAAMGTSQYFLASLADEIWLDQDGSVLLEGYSRFRQYYAEALDKLEVDVNLFRVGTYKSAMEPYILNGQSEADREAALYYLGDLWQRYLQTVSQNRGMTVEVLDDIVMNFGQYIEQAEGDMAKVALERGLVDRLISRPEMRAEMANLGTPDEEDSYLNITMNAYLDQIEPRLQDGVGRVGIIVAEGTITEGSQPAGSIGADSTARLIRDAVHDDDIKAVVLRINSGGGSAFASEVIRRELLALKDAGKPVVVSMSNVAASGGYWIAMGADEVWAYPSTITGSIGIFGFFPTFQNTFAKVGVYTDGVGTTPYAGALRPDREVSDEIAGLVQTMIEFGYQEFIGLVSEYRKMSLEAVDQVAQGRVWTGVQAQDRGLVDQLGTLQQAVASAARQAGLGDDYEITYVEPELSEFEKFITQLSARALAWVGFEEFVHRASVHPLLQMIPSTYQWRVMNELQRVNQATEAGHRGVMAHCLCEGPM
jgi:protease-4